ncbi:MAG: indole-3-glycerol phosphate synthase TrpC [Synergistaceae bacterium]|nr:indole-3-glycerol phosphate synthase TrpC [Synergistaceae bacterium]
MILRQIASQKALEVETLKRPRASLAKSLEAPGLSVVAEIKKASPSKGILAKRFEPQRQLEAYVRGGAGAVSVVTDRTFFQGSGELLRSLRPRTTLPLLRKDFLLDPLQVYESFFLGADAVLLIAALLPGENLGRMLATASSLGLETLVEVHDEGELRHALETDAPVIGFNNRDLRDFSVNLQTTVRLLRELDRLEPRRTRRVVAESGISSRKDAAFLEDLGVDGILVGESLMRSSDPAAQVRKLRGLEP